MDSRSAISISGSLASVGTWAWHYVASGTPLHILVNNAAVIWALAAAD